MKANESDTWIAVEALIGQRKAGRIAVGEADVGIAIELFKAYDEGMSRVANAVIRDLLGLKSSGGTTQGYKWAGQIAAERYCPADYVLPVDQVRKDLRTFARYSRAWDQHVGVKASTDEVAVQGFLSRHPTADQRTTVDLLDREIELLKDRVYRAKRDARTHHQIGFQGVVGRLKHVADLAEANGDDGSAAQCAAEWANIAEQAARYFAAVGR